jgi:hypothetical protein
MIDRSPAKTAHSLFFQVATYPASLLNYTTPLLPAPARMDLTFARISKPI